jgi:hypothetical protein
MLREQRAGPLTCSVNDVVAGCHVCWWGVKEGGTKGDAAVLCDECGGKSVSLPPCRGGKEEHRWHVHASGFVSLPLVFFLSLHSFLRTFLLPTDLIHPLHSLTWNANTTTNHAPTSDPISLRGELPELQQTVQDWGLDRASLLHGALHSAALFSSNLKADS